MEQKVLFGIGKSEAIVLYDYLWRWEQSMQEDESVKAVMWDLINQMEKALASELASGNWEELLEQAREQVRQLPAP